MSQVRRVYVEKKKGFDGAAQDLFHELRYYLGLPQAAGVRILVRYDAENVSEDVFKEACRCVFAEPPVDNLYEETFPFEKDDHVFSVEYLPGQFDQRADSAEQCIQFLDETQKPVIRSATTYVISGPLSDSDM